MPKMAKPKINMIPLSFYSVGGYGYGVHDAATSLFTHYGYTRSETPDDADIIVLNGGQDIATSIYGERSVVRGVPEDMGSRDVQEVALYNKYKDDKTKFFFGICRGAQLLNCLNGGTLFQHVDNHSGSHPMLIIDTGEVLQTSSVHHQQMRLGPKSTAEILAISSESSIKIAETGEYRPTPNRNDLKHGEDLEVIYFPDTRCLCIQGHPEYNAMSEFSQYCMELMATYAKELPQCAA